MENPSQTKIKIQLSAGDSDKNLFEILRKLPQKEILFSVQGSFQKLTEVSFLKNLKKTVSQEKKKVFFYVRKNYFKEVLEREGFTIVDRIPEAFVSLPSLKLMQLEGKVIATKNQIKVAKDIKFIPISKGEIPKFSTHRIDPEAAHRPLRGILFFLFLLILLFLGIIYLWISPEAVITIKPKINAIPVTQNVIIRLPDAKVSLDEESLPMVDGVIISQTVEGVQTINTLERTYEVTNASGEITLYNTTTKEKYLVPSRLSTDEGYIFRFQNPVTIPPATGDTPGSVVVRVIADEKTEKGSPIGEYGNIDAGSDLFFPALREPLRELYYGKANRGPLVGGSTLVRYFMGEEDVEKNKPQLIDSFVVQAKSAMEKELEQRSNREGTEFVIIDHPSLLVHELQDFVAPNDQVGTEQKTFEMSGKLSLRSLVFDRKAVEQYLIEKINKNQDHRKKLLSLNHSTFEYRILNYEEFQENRWVKLSVSISGVETLSMEENNAHAMSWKDGMKQEILGKSIDETRAILTNYPDIHEVIEIKTSPFWKKDLPAMLDQIEFRMEE